MKKDLKKIINRFSLSYVLVGGIILFLSIFQLGGVTLFLTDSFIPGDGIVAGASVANCEEKVSNKNLVPDRISIDKIKLDLPIVSVKLSGGTWEVHDKVANFASETSVITSNGGNVGIFAHDREPGFAKIKHLSNGDLITVSSGNFLATYRVVESEVMQPHDVEAFYPTKNPMLTLVTCDGSFSEQRYVLKAELINLEEGTCN